MNSRRAQVQAQSVNVNAGIQLESVRSVDGSAQRGMEAVILRLLLLHLRPLQ